MSIGRRLLNQSSHSSVPIFKHLKLYTAQEYLWLWKRDVTHSEKIVTEAEWSRMFYNARGWCICLLSIVAGSMGHTSEAKGCNHHVMTNLAPRIAEGKKTPLRKAGLAAYSITSFCAQNIDRKVPCIRCYQWYLISSCDEVDQYVIKGKALKQSKDALTIPMYVN